MALLWVCVAAALFMTGAMVVDYLGRRREREGFDIERWLKGGGVLSSDEHRKSQLPRTLRRLLDDIDTLRIENALTDGGLEHALLAQEERVRKGMTAPRMLVKVGPSLGLIGTLIPMGTALAALATGDLEAMSGQMIVAFTTTIIGLACGTIAYVVTAVRQNWVNETIREQRFIAERAAAELERAE